MPRRSQRGFSSTELGPCRLCLAWILDLQSLPVFLLMNLRSPGPPPSSLAPCTHPSTALAVSQQALQHPALHTLNGEVASLHELGSRPGGLQVCLSPPVLPSPLSTYLVAP